MINRSAILKLAKEFHNICRKNEIWYSLDAMTLLGAIKHGGFVPWSERFDVMISPDGYNKLKRICSNNFTDSFVNSALKGFEVYYVQNSQEWEVEQPFIRIRIAIPTTNKKIKHFRSLSKRILNFVSMRANNIKSTIDELIELNFYEGYFLPIRRFVPAKKSWIQVLSHKTVSKDFAGKKFDVPIEYEKILREWYGDNFMQKTNVPSTWKEYKAPGKAEVAR